MYKIILKALQNSNFSHIGILGPPGPRKPQVGNCTPIFIFDIFKIIGIVRTFFLYIHWFRILLISASFWILSDISGLLQGSSFSYFMFLNSISQLLTLNHATILLSSNIIDKFQNYFSQTRELNKVKNKIFQFSS